MGRLDQVRRNPATERAADRALELIQNDEVPETKPEIPRSRKHRLRQKENYYKPFRENSAHTVEREFFLFISHAFIALP